MSDQKILCLVDNSTPGAQGHKLSQKFAKQQHLTYHGLVTNQTLEAGVYHVGPMDLETKLIIKIAKEIDKVILLDQPQDLYSHHRIFLSMFKLIEDLTKEGIVVEEQNKQNFEYLRYWTRLFESNKSICVYPWVLMHDGYGDYTSLCGRATDPVTKISELKSWKNDKNYQRIRKLMINGERVSNCKICSEYEDKGIRDQRWNYSFDWIARLKIKNIEDLKKIENPVYYEIKPSNKCNAMCRMCNGNYSHLIQKENFQINDKKYKELIESQKVFEMYSSFERVDIDKVIRLYVAGGEPTVMSSLYKFLEKCINKQKTNFALNIQTNGVKLKKKFFDLCGHFKNLTISTSIDGVGKINEYVRWLTNSEEQKQNIHKLIEAGHHVQIISVISIYNVATIGETMDMFDREFPNTPVQLQFASFKKDLLDPYNHPNRKLVYKSLIKAKTTRCYWHNESGTTNIINQMFDFFGHPSNTDTFDQQKLERFFYYNDTLDKLRGSKLKDYIPDLEECRKYIQKKQ
jgi:hypothetical protein